MKRGGPKVSKDATAGRSARRTTAPGPLEYQRFCRQLIEFMRREEGWQPYEGDGIDVPIEVKGTTVTFDIALASPDRRRILLGECKAWAGALEQDHIFTLFGKITAVARETDRTVEAVLFASSGFDPGFMRPPRGWESGSLRSGRDNLSMPSPSHSPGSTTRCC
jgi:hypothetical protein